MATVIRVIILLLFNTTTLGILITLPTLFITTTLAAFASTLTATATTTVTRISTTTILTPLAWVICFIIHLMRRIQKGPVRGISLKLQEEERERRMDFVPERSEVDVPLIQVDQDTADMLTFLKLNIPNVKVITANVHTEGVHQRF
ncbi:putative 40S ribosomal protein S17 [Babesia bovis T2Bo]|uniref:40S ribosomal protein S17, putative n=1 Tax=Babesia bovis TaxID=5865 RepID=A7AM97_BABBO|nr:putative 40S ribosomal protein S17 [Babesia bovis T2Bo]XP_001611252.1 putative 40S ribosomal protein S17 [Babesia bovis T2Bo]EDO07681.1 putative 40S ribosomal protein S17 [Babesia bovis T2Bo]EDO07684.1 putative 40S ribosomal protein S17 [Babesia bovis T2Bo]|eukprot:XP_001611249.1 40S ribosomal protein S17 [Babesia bovis T2Bo]